jgi:putative acetyltransferase
MDQLLIRPIQPGDNIAIASIIRSTLTEFGAANPGTAYYDKATDDMYSSFQLPGSCYHVGLVDGQIAGGGASILHQDCQGTFVKW